MQDSQNDRANNTREWALIEKLALDSLNEQRKSRRWGIFFKLLSFAYLAVVLLALVPWGTEHGVVSVNEAHTALVSVNGVISEETEASANSIVSGLRHAFDNPRAQAIVLAINSPGGSPVQAGYVYDEIKRLRKLHPDTKIYAVISDIGASGAYYIAAAADEIFADKSSLVGSIGVISSDFGYVEGMKKLGIERRIFTAGENKAFLDPYSPLTEEHRVFWEDVLSVTHRQFIEQVKNGRGDRLKDDSRIFSGLIWTGEQALDLGLVDALGSAGQVARDVVGAEKIVDYTVQPDPLKMLLNQLGMSAVSALKHAVTAGDSPYQLRYQL